jgi:hypothetical protein
MTGLFRSLSKAETNKQTNRQTDRRTDGFLESQRKGQRDMQYPLLMQEKRHFFKNKIFSKFLKYLLKVSKLVATNVSNNLNIE